MATALLFTGHMVDLPGRGTPRFPQALVGAARDVIGAALDRFTGRPGVMGFASLARGGDIVFHEACRKRGLPTVIVLPFAPDQFVETSVDGVPGTDWPTRFWQIWNATPEERRELLGLPVSDAAYAACNAHLLERAQSHGPVHLIALWDGKGGDGPGGAADLVRKAEGAGDEPVIIPPADLREDLDS